MNVIQDLSELFSPSAPAQPRRNGGTPRNGGRRRQGSERLEVDYLENPTRLFKRIEDKAWNPALSRLQRYPSDAQTWVVRKAFDGEVTWRRLPIHEACINNAPSEIIEALINTYPHGLKQADNTKRLPLHLVCTHTISPEVVERLIRAHPDALVAEDIWFNTPLGVYKENFGQDSKVLELLQGKPENFKKNQDILPTFSGEEGEEVVATRSNGKTSRSPPPRSRRSSPQKVPNSKINRVRSPQNLASQNSTESRNPSPVPPPPAPPSRTTSPAPSPAPPSSSSRNASPVQSGDKAEILANYRNETITSLEEEIGKFSARLATSMNKENNLLKQVNDLKSKNEEYKKEKQTSEEQSKMELEQKTTRIGKLERRCKDLERKLKNAVEAMEEAETFLEGQNKTNDEFAEVEFQLNASTKKVERLQAQVQSLEREKAEAINEAQGARAEGSHYSAQLKEQLEEMGNEKAQMENEMGVLDSHLFAKDKEIDELKKKAFEAESLKLEAGRATQGLDLLRESLAHKEEDIQNKEKAIVQANLEIRELTFKLTEFEQKKGSSEILLQRKIDLYDAEMEEMKRKLSAAEQANSDVIQMTYKEKKDLGMKNSEMLGAIGNLENERNEAIQRSDALQAEVEHLKATLAQTTEEFEQRLQDSESGRGYFEGANSGLQEKVREMEMVIDKMHEEREAMERDLSNMQRLEDERHDLEQHLKERDIDIENAMVETENVKKDMEASVASYVTKLQDAESEINHLQDDFKALNSDVRQLEDKKHDLELRLKEKEVCLDDAKKENENRRKDLESTIASYVKKLDSAENEIIHLRSNCDNLDSKARQLDNLNSDKDRLDSILRKSDEENRLLRTQMKEVSEDSERKIADIDQTIKKYEIENETLKTRIRVLTDEIEMKDKDKRERRLMEEQRSNEITFKFDRLVEENRELMRHIRSIEGAAGMANDLETKIRMTQQKNEEELNAMYRDRQRFSSSGSVAYGGNPSTPVAVRERSSSPMPYMNTRDRLTPGIESRNSSQSGERPPISSSKGSAERTRSSGKYSGRSSAVDNSDNESTMSALTTRSSFQSRAETRDEEHRTRGEYRTREWASPPIREEYVSSSASVHRSPVRDYDVERLRDVQLVERSTPPPPPPVDDRYRGSGAYSVAYDPRNTYNSPGQASLAGSPTRISVVDSSFAPISSDRYGHY